MSLLPRLAPADVEMSLTDSSIFLLVFAERLWVVTDRAMVGSICLSSPCADEAMRLCIIARALFRVRWAIDNHALISFNHHHK